MSKIYEQLIQFNIKIEKKLRWAEELYKHFSEKDIQIAKRHMERLL